MAIEFYTGTPGAGKSYHVVQRIYSWNKLKKPVISNIRLNTENLLHPDLYFFIDSFDIKEASILSVVEPYLESGIKEHSFLVVLDECQLFLNSRDFHRYDRKDWLHFFSVHRHLGFDVILVTQDISFVDKQVRLLADYDIQHIAAGKIKFFKFLEFFLRHKIFVFRCKHIQTKSCSGVTWCLGRKRVYALYDTFQSFKKDNPKIKMEVKTNE